VRRQPLPVGNEFRRLPCEDEVLAGLLLPAFDGIRRGRSIEYAIEFGGFELACLLLQLRLDRQTLGVKATPPRIIVPARSADQNAGHDLFRRNTAAAKSSIHRPAESWLHYHFDESVLFGGERLEHTV